MFFSVTDDFARTENIQLVVEPVLLYYPMKHNEIVLDNYLQKKYGMGLKAICLCLILKGKLYKSSSGEKVLIFRKKSDDALAQLITYGNGKMQGSHILKYAISGTI